MARGKKKDDLAQSGIDPLSLVDIIEAIGRGAPKEPDDPLRRHGPILFGRCAEWAVEYHRQALRQGTVGDFRARALNLVERALAEECFHLGVRHTLEALRTSGDIAPEVFAARTVSLELRYEATWRDAASLCASMMREIEKVRSRKGVRGRPEAARNGDLLAGLFDARIINDAVLMVPPMTEHTRDSIAAAIPNVVREYLRLGQLRHLGVSDQDSVDRHSKRLRDVLDALLVSGGFSIIRKSK